MAQTASGTGKPALFMRILERYDPASIMKAVFYGLLAGVVITLALDYRQLRQMNALTQLSDPTKTTNPVLPPAPSDAPRDGEPLRPEVETPDETLRQQLAITLEKGGVLQLAGTIYPGSSNAFAEEVAHIGEYVKVVDLDSPGGSVEDAMAISRLIRQQGFETLVRKGALCASSCPLVLAGGKERSAEKGATVGVHQIYAADGDLTSPVEAMANAQATTARILGHLDEMDVDPALWTHAMKTPPTKLYYLSHEEMEKYNLVGATAVAEAGQ